MAIIFIRISWYSWEPC